MRVRRAHEHRVGLAWPIDVVGVLALAGDEALIFLAPNGSADAGGGHGCPPRVSCWAVWTSVLILTRRLSSTNSGSFWGVRVSGLTPQPGACHPFFCFQAEDGIRDCGSRCS